MNITLTVELLDAIIEKLNELDCPDADDMFYADYSGRAMYGEQCFGIVGHAGTLAAFAAAVALVSQDYPTGLAEEADDLLHAIVRYTSEDSMGMATIYYWPSVQAAPGVASRV